MSRSVKQDYETPREREQQARIDRSAELMDELMDGYNHYGVKYAELEAIRAALEATR